MLPAFASHADCKTNKLEILSQKSQLEGRHNANYSTAILPPIFKMNRRTNVFAATLDLSGLSLSSCEFL